MGLPGMIFFIAFVFAVFYSSIQLYYKTPPNEMTTRIIIMAIIISLSTYFTHAFLNNFLDTDKAAVPVFALCAIVVALNMRHHLSTNPK